MAKKKPDAKQTKTPKRPLGKRKSVGGPFVIGALFCEKILKEESVASIIRVVDKFTLEKPPVLPAGVRAGFTTSLFISFKSGDFKGTKSARIKVVTPAGSVTPEMSMPVVFKGEGSGPSLHIDFAMQLKEEGLHWAEIYLDNQLMTKTPLDIVFTTQEATAETSIAASHKKS